MKKQMATEFIWLFFFFEEIMSFTYSQLILAVP